ncbi:antitoxin VbhA family protein [Planococcus sp. CAU13]|uniref:antitoxin VbhA family protein n=1 Tax=Planococcus sp. CAU13 TaxID=1541197 RepID=UPI00053006B4|nr:antitoxin VbhA family protein [Planococcus sp. CAU13]
MNLNSNSNSERQKRVRFAVGMAAIDGGKPTAFTQNLLKQYENGEVSERQLKKAILDKYTKVSQ